VSVLPKRELAESKNKVTRDIFWVRNLFFIIQISNIIKYTKCINALMQNIFNKILGVVNDDVSLGKS
jgi:hypothetical protein